MADLFDLPLTSRTDAQPNTRESEDPAASPASNNASNRAANKMPNKGPNRASNRGAQSYTASDIEVLEGLEPVRRRPGMYIGGTDEKALHHLVCEVIDNAMDEAGAGHANRIDVTLDATDTITVGDNGRGIPVDPHPKFPDKPAVEVILTTLHSGGKFSDTAYQTAGGLHGVGLSVVNALSDRLSVSVTRQKRLWTQDYGRGKPLGPPRESTAPANRRGTRISFHPDPDIFGSNVRFDPAHIYRLVEAKAYLHRGVTFGWHCAPERANCADGRSVPEHAVLSFPGGLEERLHNAMGQDHMVCPPFSGSATIKDGRIEWAIAWLSEESGQTLAESYCNTVPTPRGGHHETGLRNALLRSIKDFGARLGVRQAKRIGAEDIMEDCCFLLSLFIKQPQFEGQTKEKLSMPGARRAVEAALKDRFDHWLTAHKAAPLLEHIVRRAEERHRAREAKALVRRTSATRKLRLPGKLTDCVRRSTEGTEIFIVEGDSAGGSAKQARQRETQAVLPLRGKILNAASASADKLRANRELTDLAQALGCGSGAAYQSSALRYEKVIILTDADVDGAHIASLLMTYFYREMMPLVAEGRLYLAIPPLYRLARGDKVLYARDDAHKDSLLAGPLSGAGKVEISRFKGLGEMPADQLRRTTMDPASRTLIRVTLPPARHATEATCQTACLVEDLMGRKPEKRLDFIRRNAELANRLDI